MLYIVPNVYQLIQIISLYYISGDPISQNIAKITTFGLEMSCQKPLKLLHKWYILKKNAKIFALKWIFLKTYMLEIWSEKHFLKFHNIFLIMFFVLNHVTIMTI